MDRARSSMISENSWSEAARSLARRAAGLYARNLILAAALGVALAGASWYFLRQRPTIYGAFGAGLAFIETVGVAAFVGFQRALALASAEKVAALNIGGYFVRL